MKQNKITSLVESITNTVVGLTTSFLIQIVIYPLLDIKVSISQNVIITLVFFVASITRGYIIRRVFESLKK
jgi:hypothetical protein